MIHIRISPRPRFYRTYLAHRAYLKALLGGIIVTLMILSHRIPCTSARCLGMRC